MKNWMRLLVAMGCALRLYHYFRNPSVWHDEAALIVNVLRLDFRQLLGPLLWNEAAPPLFLWLERAVALLFGESTFALRLIPVLASCGTLILVAATVVRWLPPRGAFCTMLLLVVSDRLLWHSCEAKPYAADVFLASLALFAYTFTQRWPIAYRITLLMAASPIMIFLSYPACFVCGGLWLALVPEVWRARSWRVRLLCALWAVAIVCAFGAMYAGPIRSQRTGPMEQCWAGHFPNWSRPWRVPIWSVANTVETLRYAFKPLGSFLALAALIGGLQCWRSRNFAWLTLLVAPIGLTWCAACVGGYPYGGSRLEAFLAPALAILVGAGVATLYEWFQQRRVWGLGYPVAVLLLIALAVNTALVTVHPWPRPDAASAAAYVHAHRQADERVLINHWEYAYYFRDCPHFFLQLEPPAVNGREWLVVTAAERAGRAELLAEVSRRGKIIERRDFTMVTVALIDLGGSEVAQR